MAGNPMSYGESLTVFPSALIVGSANNLYNERGLNGGRGFSPVVPFPMHPQSEDEFTTPSFPFPDDQTEMFSWTTGNGTDISDSSSSYSSPAAVFATLVTFSIFTIFGNSLVMLAVSREHYLKSPPNYFIASLAAADFSVGVLLVPFEAISQLLNRRWIFGNVWCELWHSFDVLLTTASILNLCVISLDRYWAICTPLHYSRRMTSKRAFRFIALVWICAIAISLPAIFWWRSVRKGPVPFETCPFTDDVSYLVSSSCVSFYIPLSVMIFAYFKIYLAAIKQSRSIQQGIKQFTSHDKNGADITLRMHRGGGAFGGSNNNTTEAIANGVGESSQYRKTFPFGTSDPSGLALLNEAKQADSQNSVRKNGIIRLGSILKRHGSRKVKERRAISDSMIPPEESSTSTGSTGIIVPNGHVEFSPEQERTETRTGVAAHLIADPLAIISNVTTAGQTSSARSAPPSKSQYGRSNSHHTIPSVSFRRQSRRSFTVARKLAKFAKEKKAAKTLGIVLGVFIICWLPFFVINIIFALCKSCAEGQMVVFEVATWLGWMNSAMNPVIYACWSHDFRRAFARLLGCRRCRNDRQWRSQRRMSIA